MVSYPSSSYTTTDVEDGITIKFTDVYIVNKRIVFNTDEKQPIPSATTWNNSHGFDIHQEKINQTEEYRTIDLAVISDNPFYVNIGHGLWDGIYPAYVSLCKWGYENQDFVYITTEMSNQQTLAYEPTKLFTGVDIWDRYNLPNEIIKINTLIVGTGQCGNLVMGKDYTLYGGKWNALEKFKNRLYEKYNITHKPRNAQPKIVWIENKRYKTAEKELIQTICNELNIEWVEYSNIGRFKEHLEYFSDIDIQITGPGTGMMYSPFLKKGSVIINLGWMEEPQKNGARPNIYVKNYTNIDWKFPSYMEQGVITAIKWASVLYYDRYKCNDIEYQPIKELINEGIKQYYKNSIKNKHAIDGQIYIEYCKRDKDSDDVVKDLTRKSLFAEMMINEHPLATEKVNIPLLRQIKKEYGYDERYIYKI